MNWLKNLKLMLLRRRVLLGSAIFFAVLGLGIYVSKAVSVHAVSYRSIVQAESTVLNYWPMDDASGSSTLSALVGGNNINLTGATTGVAGQVDGTSVSFNGTTNFGRTASTLNLSSYNQVVVEALVNLPATDNSGRAGWELTSNTNTGTTGFLFTTNEPSVTPHKMTALLKGNTGFSYGYYTIPTASQWHHVAIVYDKSLTTNETEMYIDGVLQTATSRPNNYNNTNTFANDYFYLMSRGGTSLFGQGKMQHLAIYSSLSSARILAHANAALSSLTPGTLAETSHTTTSATLNWTGATNNSGSVTSQLQRSASGAAVWSDVAGATSSPSTDTGLSTSTIYDYRVAYTDSLATAYSNTVSVNTGSVSMTPHAVDVSELWDNGYDNISAPRQSSFSRFVFTTDASTITVSGTTNIYGVFPQYAHLGVRVDGVDLSPLAFTANDSETFSVSLGSAGTTRTVEITSGLESKPSSTVIGTYIDSVSYESTASFNIQTPTVGSRVLVYGDSISVGGNSTNPETQSYFSLLRNTYNYRVMNESYGYRSLNDDASTSGARAAFVSRVAGYTPSTIWMAIGTNDYGINKWTPANFGTAYAATLDDLHTALPSARIFCQTPLVRSTETANGLGYTLTEYRDQITTVCNARAWTTLVDGSSILATSDLADGLHPTTAGHIKYANKVAPYLANPSYTVSGPSSGLTNAASTTFTASIASGTFTGAQTVTLSAASGIFTATAVGGSISGNGTSSAIVTPANTATSFTFTYTPSSTGAKSLVFTNGQNWSNPTAATYTVTDSNTAPNTPSSLGGAGYVDGSWSTDTTPTLAFTLADTDVADTVKYTIQVDDSSDFGSPVVDYTSALAAQGSQTFTVGQAAGGGTYTTGSASTTLSDASYYWRVKAIDEHTSESSYATANSGSIAFKIDTTAPTISVVTPVATPTSDSTPDYVFTTNEAGTILYGGSCSSATTSATSGSNTVTFNSLADGTYSNCTITVTDASGNASIVLAVSAFTVDTVVPTATLSPLDNATGVSPTTNLVLSFSETVNVNSGNIAIKKTSDNTTVETIDVTGGQVTGTGTSTITINPGVTLLDLTEYYVQIPNTAFRDQVLLSYAGISSTTAWSFTTADTTVPTITNVSSDKANGSYKVGEVIDIDVTFSEAVTSTGNVTVTLETGATDRTCTFIVSSTTSGSCNYTVQAGDSSADLTVGSISGTIADASSNAMTDFVPTTNLAANKALVIDTTAPTISVVTPVATPTSDSTPDYVFTTNEAGTILYGGSCSSATTSATSGSNTVTFNSLADGTYSNCTAMVTDAATNASSTLSVGSFTIDTAAPTTPGDPETVSSTNDTTPTWTWSDSTDGGSGLAANAYTIEWSQDSSFVSGVSSATASSASYTHSTGLSNGTWYVRVRAFDVAGNSSGYSSNGSIVISAVVVTAPEHALSNEPQTVNSDAAIKSEPVLNDNRIIDNQDSQEKTPEIKLLNDFLDYTSGRGLKLDMHTLDTVRFSLLSGMHGIQVTEIGSDYVKLLIRSEPINARIALGKTELFDVDQNGSNDITIKLVSVTKDTAQLEFSQINQVASTPASVSLKKSPIWSKAIKYSLALVLTVIIAIIVRRKLSANSSDSVSK